METKPENEIVFEVVDDSKLDIPSVINPSYIYKVGDTFRWVDAFAEPPVFADLVVTSVKMELHNHITPEQHFIVHVEKVEEK